MFLPLQGVMLTHANILSVVAGQLGAINQVAGRYGEKFNQDDVMISYLPLAHIFDRCECPYLPDSEGHSVMLPAF